HGVAGNSRSAAMPIIAGLDAAYFKKQIEAYASGKRLSPEMEPYAKQVLDMGVDDVAAYFAASPHRRRVLDVGGADGAASFAASPRQATPITSPADSIARGRTAAAACAACHGPQGQGDTAKHIPSLGGAAAADL